MLKLSKNVQHWKILVLYVGGWENGYVKNIEWLHLHLWKLISESTIEVIVKIINFALLTYFSNNLFVFNQYWYRETFKVLLFHWLIVFLGATLQYTNERIEARFHCMTFEWLNLYILYALSYDALLSITQRYSLKIKLFNYNATVLN